MLELPAVTLVCIDSQQPALALAAIEQSMIRCRFAAVVFVTDKPTTIKGLKVVSAGDLATPAARARFIAQELHRHVDTSHALLIGWDAFIVNPDAWDDAFLEHDCVIARRKASRVDEEASSSTGIALVSQALLERMTTLPDGVDPLAALATGNKPTRTPSIPTPASDDHAHAANDPELDLIEVLNVRRPPVELRDRFAFGDYAPVGSPFGFERLFNMWMLFQPSDLSTFIAMAPASVLASRDARSLALNLHSLGRINEATTLLKAIVGADPADQALKDVLEALSGRQPAVTATVSTTPQVGRNDPCPCGSGRRYKQCHGALGARTLVPGAGSTPATTTAIGTGGTNPLVTPAFLQHLPQPEGAGAVWMHRAREAFRRNDSVADALHRKAVEAEPDNAEATSYLGIIAMRQGRPDEADKWLRHAVQLAPHSAEYQTNLGMFRQMRGDEAGALTAYADAIRLDPKDAPAHNNLGLLLQEMGRTEAAIAAFRKAIDAVPAFADAHWNLALALLATGDFEHGLEEQEWRMKAAQQRAQWDKRAHFAVWRGEPLHGKRILILAEQGIGDILQNIRYAIALAERGASVVVEAPAEIAALMRTTRGVTLVAPMNGPFPACDYQIAAMSLPHAFGTRLDSIPAPVPYVLPDPARTARWKALLGDKVTGAKPRIGVNWSGNPQQARNRTRSLPLSMLEPLLGRADIEWVNLHKGSAADEIANLSHGVTIRDLMPRVEDFADTAALLTELDLVISTDTGVAHLAGALGVPTLMLLDAAPDCRWMLERNDSPWYPTMRLIRQKKRGDWSEVVAEAMREVEQRFGVVALERTT